MLNNELYETMFEKNEFWYILDTGRALLVCDYIAFLEI